MPSITSLIVGQWHLADGRGNTRFCLMNGRFGLTGHTISLERGSLPRGAQRRGIYGEWEAVEVFWSKGAVHVRMFSV